MIDSFLPLSGPRRSPRRARRSPRRRRRPRRRPQHQRQRRRMRRCRSQTLRRMRRCRSLTLQRVRQRQTRRRARRQTGTDRRSPACGNSAVSLHCWLSRNTLALLLLVITTCRHVKERQWRRLAEAFPMVDGQVGSGATRHTRPTWRGATQCVPTAPRATDSAPTTGNAVHESALRHRSRRRRPPPPASISLGMMRGALG